MVLTPSAQCSVSFLKDFQFMYFIFSPVWFNRWIVARLSHLFVAQETSYNYDLKFTLVREIRDFCKFISEQLVNKNRGNFIDESRFYGDWLLSAWFMQLIDWFNQWTVTAITFDIDTNNCHIRCQFMLRKWSHREHLMADIRNSSIRPSWSMSLISVRSNLVIAKRMTGWSQMLPQEPKIIIILCSDGQRQSM